jgi:hypothetical protein
VTTAAGTPDPRFLPWLRTGLAGSLTVPAVDGLAPADTATLVVQVALHSEGPGGDAVDPLASPPVRLRAPGEVVGIDPGLMVRHDPTPNATDAEANYFTVLELAEPDLPWRYTPAAAAGDRLQPWLALVVVEDRSAVLEHPGGGRLPVLTVPVAELPDLAQCWAWAHVQADHDLAAGVAASLVEAPAAFRSRLMCPRRLRPDRGWLACVVPTFEGGRRAGLGLAGVTGAGAAWDRAAGGEVTLPVYYWWRFRTGPRGDFESLVRRLTPRELGADVGVRDLDLSRPGGGLPEAPGAVLSYLGALVSPAARPRPWSPRHRTRTKAALRQAVNRTLAPAPVASPYDALTDDPVVGPAAYGAAQAHRRQVPAPGEPPGWFEALNTEPPHRAVGGLGTEVVRRDQETLMAAAWEHAAGVRAANRLLGRARLAWELAARAAVRLASLADDSLVQVAGPAMRRLAHPSGGTLRGAVAASDLPAGLITGAFRRAVGRTPAARRAGTAGVVPARAVTAAVLGDPVGVVGRWATVWPPAGADLRGQTAQPELPAVGAAGPPAPRRRATLTPAPGRVPREFVLAQPVRPADLVVPYAGKAPPAVPGSLAAQVREALDGPRTVVRYVEASVSGLPRDRAEPVPARVLARPTFTTPMYERLRALSAEYLVPGIGSVPDDTVALLVVNRAFVEAFLAGACTELSREFRWREYPARPDGTWFPRFWDSGPGGAADIRPIASWDPLRALGDNPPPGTPQVALVLLITGALPRRYPDLQVYAVEAAWKGGKRREAVGGRVELPAFAGVLGRSAFFYGFALSEAEARGSTRPDSHPGFFLVLEQRPGAPRFGLDAARPQLRGRAPAGWSDLSWAHLAREDQPLPDFVDVSGPDWLIEAGALPGNGGPDAWGEDAAAMARITLQRPVRLLVHADAMLPPARPGG